MPSVTDSIPALIGFDANPGTNFVPPKPTLHLEFSVKMLAQSLNTSEAVNIGASLFGPDDDTYELEYVDYVPATRTLKIRPVDDLTPGLRYKIVIDAKTDGFLSAAGRPLFKSTFYEFLVNDFSLPKVSLIGPGNGVIVPSQVDITVFCPAVTGTNLLVTQVSRNIDFQVIDWTGSLSATGSANHLFTIGTPLLTDNLYYFRARATSATPGLGAGEWSDVWNFYYGTRESVYPESRRQIEDTAFAGVDFISFIDGVYNLTAWPTISITFMTDIPTGSTGYFSVTREPVDGGMPVAVNGTWVIVDNVATFTPSDDIMTNNRYTIRTLFGLQDVNGDDIPLESYYFVSRYQPFYAQPMEVRAVLGGLVGDVSDDLIAFFIHKTSMDANWRSRLQPYQLIDPLFIFGGANMTDLQFQRSPALYAIHEWVVLGTAIHLLETKLYEFVPGADGSLQIADYRESLGSSALLKFINDKVKELRRRQEEYEMQFSRRATRPRSGVRSSNTSFGVQTAIDRGYKPGRHSF